VLLTQWAELDRKFSEFHELITLEGNKINVVIHKKLISDLQLEWEELNKKSNIVLEYVCVCVFLASGYGWGAVMHEIPISSPPS
jgi:hypothetical protein